MLPLSPVKREKPCIIFEGTTVYIVLSQGNKRNQQITVARTGQQQQHQEVAYAEICRGRGQLAVLLIFSMKNYYTVEEQWQCPPAYVSGIRQ